MSTIIDNTLRHLAELGGSSVDESDEELARFLSDLSNVHLLGLLNPPREGVAEFFYELEHTHFPPGTHRNDLFQLRLYPMGEDVIFGIVSVPCADRRVAEELAAKHRLKLASGGPMLLVDGAAHTLPTDGPNIFTLEYVSGHPAYGRRADAPA